MLLSPLSETIQRGVNNPQLMEAALALHDNRLSDAEPLLRAHLKADPFDVAAIRMMAELAGPRAPISPPVSIDRINRQKPSPNLISSSSKTPKTSAIRT